MYHICVCLNCFCLCKPSLPVLFNYCIHVYSFRCMMYNACVNWLHLTPTGICICSCTHNWNMWVASLHAFTCAHAHVIVCSKCSVYVFLWGRVRCNVCLTQWGAVCDQDVCVVWDLVPLVQQSLTPWQVEAPAIVPGLPTDTDGQRQKEHLVRSADIII